MSETANCSTAMRLEGKGYPRTCKVCSLGPCKFFDKQDQPLPTPVIHRPIGAEMERLRAKIQEEKSHFDGPPISRFFNYKHELHVLNNPIMATAAIVRDMKTCSYLKDQVQVKINVGQNISRISDYNTRAEVDPAVSEGWWFEEDRICSGTEEEYQARRNALS